MCGEEANCVQHDTAVIQYTFYTFDGHRMLVILSRSEGSLVLDGQEILRCRVPAGRVMTKTERYAR